MFRALQQRAVVPLSAAVVASVLVAGCQRAESARADTAHPATNVQHQLDPSTHPRYRVAAADSYRLALLRAQGAHHAALQQCEPQSGEARRQCRDQAEADYQAARAHAESLELSPTL